MTQELNVGRLTLVHKFADDDSKADELLYQAVNHIVSIDGEDYVIFDRKLYSIENMHYEQPDESYLVNTFDDGSIDYVLFHDSSVSFEDAIIKALTGAKNNEDL